MSDILSLALLCAQSPRIFGSARVGMELLETPDESSWQTFTVSQVQRAYLQMALLRPLLLFPTGYISSSVMIPQRRFSTLLSQARSHQLQRCLYHNSPLSTETFSLYTDHQCDKTAFPRITTLILEGHTDEVWNIEWSHDGNYLASASKDKTAIIWKIEVSALIRPQHGDFSRLYSIRMKLV